MLTDVTECLLLVKNIMKSMRHCFFHPTVETNTKFFRGETIEVTVVSFDKFILILQFV